MAENAAPTLVPHHPDIEVKPPTANPESPKDISSREALLDSIAWESVAPAKEDRATTFKSVFAGILWLGYAMAIVVALVLVWSAVNGLLKALPR